MASIESMKMDVPNCHDVIYKEHVIFAVKNRKDEYAVAIYEFYETPEETGLDEIECRLNRIAIAEEYFKDSGSAIKWAFDQL